MDFLSSTIGFWLAVVPHGLGSLGAGQNPDDEPRLFPFYSEDGQGWQFVQEDGTPLTGLEVRESNSQPVWDWPPQFSLKVVPQYSPKKGYQFFNRNGELEPVFTERLQNDNFNIVRLFSKEFVSLSAEGEDRHVMLVGRSRPPLTANAGRQFNDGFVQIELGLLYDDGHFESWKKPLEKLDDQVSASILRLEGELLEVKFRDFENNAVLGLLRIAEASDLLSDSNGAVSAELLEREFRENLLIGPDQDRLLLKRKSIGPFHNGYARIECVDGRCTLIDWKGVLALANFYDDVQPLSASGEPTPLKVGETWHYYKVTPGFRETRLKDDALEGNSDGFADATPFEAGVAAVKIGARWFWINRKGDPVLEFDDSRPDGSAPVNFGSILEIGRIHELRQEDGISYGYCLVRWRDGVGVVETRCDGDGNVEVDLLGFHNGKWEGIGAFDGRLAPAWRRLDGDAPRIFVDLFHDSGALAPFRP